MDRKVVSFLIGFLLVAPFPILTLTQSPQVPPTKHKWENISIAQANTPLTTLTVNSTLEWNEGTYTNITEKDGIIRLDHLNETVWKYTEPDSSIWSVVIDKEGGYVYAGSDGGELHKVTLDGSFVWNYTEHTDNVYDIAVGDEYIYTASADNEVHKITLDGSFVWNYTEHTDAVRGVTVDEDGYVYTVSQDKELHKVDPSGSQVWTLLHADQILSVTYCDGYVYTGDLNQELHKVTPDGSFVWNYTEHTGSIQDITVDEEGYVYSGATDNELHKVTPDGSFVWNYTEHTDRVTGVAIDEDGYLYTSSNDKELHKVDPSGSQVWIYTKHTGWVNDVTVNEKGYVYTASADNEVHKIRGQYQKGSYNSKIFSSTENIYWTHLKVGGMEDASLVNVTVQTSNSNFSNLLNEQKITELQNGTTTYELPFHNQNRAKSIRFNITMEAGSSPSVDSVVIDGYYARPVIESFTTSQSSFATGEDISLSLSLKADYSEEIELDWTAEVKVKGETGGVTYKQAGTTLTLEKDQTLTHSFEFGGLSEEGTYTATVEMSDPDTGEIMASATIQFEVTKAVVGIPWFVWAIIGAIVIAIITASVFVVRRRTQKKF